jgi:hypothetical protein
VLSQRRRNRTRALLACAVVLGVVGVLLGNWLIVIAMVLTSLGQILVLRRR